MNCNNKYCDWYAKEYVGKCSKPTHYHSFKKSEDIEKCETRIKYDKDFFGPDPCKSCLNEYISECHVCKHFEETVE